MHESHEETEINGPRWADENEKDEAHVRVHVYTHANSQASMGGHFAKKRIVSAFTAPHFSEVLHSVHIVPLSHLELQLHESKNFKIMTEEAFISALGYLQFFKPPLSFP